MLRSSPALLSLLASLALPACERTEATPTDASTSDAGLFALTSGDYDRSGSTLLSDDCDLGWDDLESMDARDATLTVNGDSVVLGFTDPPPTATRTGNMLESTRVEELDLRPTADCVMDVTSVTSGEIVADNELDLTYEVTLTRTSGSGCAAAGKTLPCTSAIEFELSYKGE